ncbi:MAG: CCA tRNA nucleotidyltransferase [Candidatus Odinarchaeia archaeon]
MIGERILHNTVSEVLKRIVPRDELRRLVYKTADSLVKKLNKKIEENKINAKACLEGSLVRDTWLADSPEIDIFIIFDVKYPLQEIVSKGVTLAKSVLSVWEDRHAQHPYIRGRVNGIQVDIVPCYDISQSGKIITAVDRTPLHTKYIMKNLKEHQKNDVRLLKAFMRGIGVYGAEIKVRGFSGYLTELLIIKYDNFVNLLKEVAQWKFPYVIDLMEHYSDLEAAIKVFPEPLIVIDPVDRKRNVASPVSAETLMKFKAAAYRFLRHPGINYFYPPETPPLSTSELKMFLDRRKTCLVVLLIHSPKIPPDVLWGQLLRSLKAFKDHIEKNEFKIVRAAVWTDEVEKVAFIFEVENPVLSNIIKRTGPKINDPNQDIFIEKYLKAPDTLSGPYIKDDRWIVEVERKIVHIRDFLHETLNKHVNQLGIGKYIKSEITKGYKVLLNLEVSELIKENEDFSRYLREFYVNRVKWIDHKF